jgi:hypothetical protein
MQRQWGLPGNLIASVSKSPCVYRGLFCCLLPPMSRFAWSKMIRPVKAWRCTVVKCIVTSYTSSCSPPGNSTVIGTIGRSRMPGRAKSSGVTGPLLRDARPSSSSRRKDPIEGWISDSKVAGQYVETCDPKYPDCSDIEGLEEYQAQLTRLRDVRTCSRTTTRCGSVDAGKSRAVVILVVNPMGIFHTTSLPNYEQERTLWERGEGPDGHRAPQGGRTCRKKCGADFFIPHIADIIESEA